MRYVYLALILLAGLLIPAAAEAQVTTTGLSSKGTLTVGQIITSGTSATVLYAQQTGTTGVVRGIITTTLFDAAGWGPLDTGVLTGLSLTGGLVSTTAQINGLLTTTGGVVTNSASITSLTSTTITSTGLLGTTLTISGTSTLTGALNVTGAAAFANRTDFRNASSTKMSIGTAGTGFVIFADTTPASYQSIIAGFGIGFGNATTANVGIASTTDGLLKITNGTTTSGFGTIQTGGFASNFRAITTTGNLTVTDSVVTTTTNVTVSLPSTSITGQQFIVKNIGSVTNTVSVVGGVKTIDGATTQAIVSGAGKSSAMTFTYDGTNYIISQ